MRIIIFIFVLFIFCSCSANRLLNNFKENYRMNEHSKIQKCSESWNYQDLEDVEKMKILIFNKSHRFDLLFFPNMFVGINSLGDTIGILDLDFKGDVKEGDSVSFKPVQWPEWDKKYPNSGVRIFPKKIQYKNKYYCSVRNVYFGGVKED